MLGEQVGEDRGHVTTMRVLPTDGPLRMEVSFQASGMLCGLATTCVGTYTTVLGTDGVLHGEGQGLVTAEPGEMATWRGHGVGRATSDGGTSFRGALFYRTSSPVLSRLNGIVVVFEYEVAASGKTEAKTYEWI